MRKITIDYGVIVTHIFVDLAIAATGYQVGALYVTAFFGGAAARAAVILLFHHLKLKAYRP